ncbi:MAG: methyl-accepting chemotaxis protein [Lachnospiraceae bacterium]|nr:methyl-accepting chemotaxis protein [Lachnospiraceae bacterium]
MKSGKHNYFQSIKGKIVFMGIFAIALAAVVGTAGIRTMNENEVYNQIQTYVNELNLLNEENRTLEAEYRNYKKPQYLDDVVENYKEMYRIVSELSEAAGEDYQNAIKEIQDTVQKSSANYSEMSSLSSERGYSSDIGLYQEYLAANTAVEEAFGKLLDKGAWIEMHWMDGHLGETGELVEVDGTEYRKLSYSKPMPAKVKRSNMSFRMGGTFTYDGKVYITNIRWKNGNDVIPYDMETELTSMNGSNQAFKAVELTTFNGKPAMCVTCTFNAANGGWEEFAIEIPIVNYAAQDYELIEYDMYYEQTDTLEYFQYGGAYTGMYEYGLNLEALDRYAGEYTLKVVEGADVTEAFELFEALNKEIQTNIPLYTSDAVLIDAAAQAFGAKHDIITQMLEKDQKVLALQKENLELSATMTGSCGKVTRMVSEDIEDMKDRVVAMNAGVIILATVVLVLITVIISTGISRNVKMFQEALEVITQGKISVRIKTNGKDEFSLFGRSLNMFLDKMEESITQLQEISVELAETGEVLDEKANVTQNAAKVMNNALADISKGAGTQAADIEASSREIRNMCDNMSQIIRSVDVLSRSSDDMRLNGNEATSIIKELSANSTQTTEAFSNISEQIKKTNDSVIKIQEVVNLIAQIAAQTNLLSLNASIEAARAGEAGRGFAVVASEIQKLAEQTNSSAKIIDQIIMTLSEESKEAVSAMNEMTCIIAEQKTKLDETCAKFVMVSDGIEDTTDGMQEVLRQADKGNKTGKTVSDLIISLSVVAEENAAAAEDTKASMEGLNEATISLAATAQKLNRLSMIAKQNLQYYSTE